LRQLAAEWQRPIGELEAIQQSAVKHFMHWNSTNAAPVEAAPQQEEMTAAEMEALLRRYDFSELGNDAEKRYVARRLSELAELLEVSSQRALCRTMIMHETMIEYVLDPSIRILRSRITKHGEAAQTADSKADFRQLMEYLGQRGDVAKQLAETMKSLGISEEQTSSIKSKSAFQGSVSNLLEGIRAYYALDSNQLIDGVYRAAEVTILTTPYTLRDVQYRAELPLVTVPAALAGLFDPDFKAPKVSRKATRRLREGLKEGLRKVRAEEGEAVADLGDALADEEAEHAEASGESAMPNMSAAPTQT